MASFRLIDVLVTIGIACCLLGVTIAARHQAQADAGVVGCAENLQQIAQSLVMYESAYDGKFPRTRYTPGAPLAGYTQPNAINPFDTNGPAANDVTASMFLLARVMDLPTGVFICPAAMNHGFGELDPFDRASSKKRSNFYSRLNDTYSLANMYPDSAAVASGYSLDHFHERLPVDFVLASDTNPGGSITTATKQASPDPLRGDNSPNHERDGQNMLYTDGSVHFTISPFAGVNGDNVYGGRPGTFQPAGPNDSVLVPVWSMGPQSTPYTTINRRWFLGISMAVTLLLIAGIVIRGTRRTEPLA